jgi:hypothetical protein
MDDKVMQEIQAMGEISIKAHFVKNLRSVATTNRSLGPNLQEVGVLPEKALKGRALSHQIT